MNVHTQARQPIGIPVGGQFAAARHPEPDLALGQAPAAPDDSLTVEDLPWMGEDDLRVVKPLLVSLELMGLKGRLDEIAVDGENLEGRLVTPEGPRLGFYLTPDAVDVWRNDEEDVDAAHRGVVVSRTWEDTYAAGRTIARAFATARSRARIADAWFNRSHLRSTGSTKFGLPELVTEHGRQVGAMELGTPSGDYRVVIGRGGFEAEIYNSDEVQLSPRMATAVLLDASEDGGFTADADEVKYALIRSLEADLGEQW